MNQFNQLNLNPVLLSELNNAGFMEPTEIQSSVLTYALDGKDTVACAATGGGKTLAFLIPILNKISSNSHSKAIILAPTREIAEQISKVVATINNDLKVKASLLIGGTSMQPQLRRLKKNPRLIIGTPGRICDHLQRRSLDLSKFDMITLDECDRLLDMGFEPQLKQIQDAMPKERQSLLFSATLPKSVARLIERNLEDPIMIGVEERSGMPTIPKQIVQKVLNTDSKFKNHTLLREIETRAGSMIIFTRTKRRTDQLARFLEKAGHNVSLIHGGRSQRQRQQALNLFKNGRTSMLVATDVAARGIDVPDVGHVVNYDLPHSPEDFVHRIGRTGRAGAEGESLSLVVPEEKALWSSIELFLESGVVKKVKGPSRGRSGGGRGRSAGGRSYGGGGRSRRRGPGGASGGRSERRSEEGGRGGERSERRSAAGRGGERSERRSAGGGKSENSGFKMGGMQRARQRNQRRKKAAMADRAR